MRGSICTSRARTRVRNNASHTMRSYISFSQHFSGTEEPAARRDRLRLRRIPITPAITTNTIMYRSLLLKNPLLLLRRCTAEKQSANSVSKYKIKKSNSCKCKSEFITAISLSASNYLLSAVFILLSALLSS